MYEKTSSPNSCIQVASIAPPYLKEFVSHQHQLLLFLNLLGKLKIEKSHLLSLKCHFYYLSNENAHCLKSHNYSTRDICEFY